MQQLLLFGEMEGRPPLPPPAEERDIVFYALLLGAQLWAPVSRLVTAQRAAHGITGRMRPTDTFHISVLGLGFADELEDEDLELAAAVAADVAIEPFEVMFPELVSWSAKKKDGEPCPLVLTCDTGRTDILRLSAKLTAGLIARGFRPRSFTPEQPHLTLLYDSVHVPPTPLNPPVIARVEGFSLVYSHRGEGRYTVLWPER
jgi:2'-5' RNA ligase